MPETSEKRGCFFYGCLVFVLLFIAVMIGTYFGTRKAVQLLVTRYTAAAPAEIPRLQISTNEQRILVEQVQRRVQAALAGNEPEPVVISEAALNSLAAQSPELQKWAKHFYLEPEAGKLKAHVSLPLDQLEAWQQFTKRLGSSLKGRYLNGVASLSSTLTNGHLSIVVQEMEVNGQSLPKEFMAGLSSQNFAQELNTDPEVRNTLERIEKAEINEGQISLHFKPDAEPAK